MKGKLAALFIALLLAFALPMAFAADSRIESVEYKGFGVLKIEFTRDCDWYTSAEIKLTDMMGLDVPYVVLGGEAEEAYLRVEAMTAGTEYTLSFTLDGVSQTVNFTADSAVEYRVDPNGSAVARQEKDRCDSCGSAGHDEDFCPERIDAAKLPTDADALARIFDIDRCDRCGGIGHDDDRCPNR